MLKSGWEVGANYMLTDDMIGVGICSYKSSKKLPKHDLIRDALIRAGIDCKDVSIRDNTVPLGQNPALLLVVGRKQ